MRLYSATLIAVVIAFGVAISSRDGGAPGRLAASSLEAARAGSETPARGAAKGARAPLRGFRAEPPVEVPQPPASRLAGPAALLSRADLRSAEAARDGRRGYRGAEEREADARELLATAHALRVAESRALGTVALEHLRLDAGGIEARIEGRDAVGDRELVLWRLDSPHGRPVAVARSRSAADGFVRFGPILVPQAGALVAASEFRADAAGAPALLLPGRQPSEARVTCSAGVTEVRGSEPSARLVLADARGIALPGSHLGPLRFERGAPLVRVAVRRHDDALSAWREVDPSRCSEEGGVR